MAKNTFKRFHDQDNDTLEFWENVFLPGFYFIQASDNEESVALRFTREELEEIADYIKGLP